VERRLSPLRETDEGEVCGHVRGALGELWALAAAASSGMTSGNCESPSVPEKDAGAISRMRGPGAGMMKWGDRLVMQVPVSFDPVPANSRERLYEVNLTGVAGEVCLPGGVFHGTIALRMILWPAGLSEIGDYCFCESGVEIVDLTSTGIVRLGAFVFAQCRALRIVLVPSTLATLGDGAWEGCSLVRMDLEFTQMERLPPVSFQSCCDLKDVVCPVGLTGIGDGCFRYSGVVHVDLSHSSVRLIGSNVWRGCWSLQRVALPRTLRELGGGCFCCSGLQFLDMSICRLRSLPWGLFQDCRSLWGLTLPFSLERIKSNAFFGCGLWCLEVNPERIRAGWHNLSNVLQTNTRVCLRAATRMRNSRLADGGRPALVFSGSPASGSGTPARPLSPCG
jgi:hypothetical protein